MNKFTLSFIIIIFSLIFTFYYVKAEYYLVQNTRANIVLIDDILKNAKSINPLIEETKKNIADIEQSSNERLKVLLPEVVDPIRLANNIQGMAASDTLGIVLENIKVDAGNKKYTSDQLSSGTKLLRTGKVFSSGNNTTPPKEKTEVNEEKYKSTKITFTMITTYEKFKLFLHEIERSLTLMKITSLSFKQIKENIEDEKARSGGPARYQYNIGLETYSLK